MNKTFDVKFNENDLKTIKDLIKEKGIRHFKLECDLYGVLDVVLYEEYQKLEKEKDKEIEKIDKAIDKIQCIIDYGFDYDGFNTVESLKGLIDMLVDYARQSKDILQGSDE